MGAVLSRVSAESLLESYITGSTEGGPTRRALADVSAQRRHMEAPPQTEAYFGFRNAFSGL